MKSLVECLRKKRVLVSDGAWGTLLHQMGLKTGECPEAWNLSHPEQVRSIACRYIDAGADMVLTNSFGGSRFKLEHFGLEKQVLEINRSAARLSRAEAVEDHFVLGSMGPTGKMLMMEDVTEAEWTEAFGEQARALAEGGADVILIETMSAVEEALCAVRGARNETRCEIACTFTFEKTVSGDYRTMMGISPGQMAEILLEEGADIVGANCGTGMENMIDIVREIRSFSRDVPVLIHANAGMPEIRNGETVFPETPEDMVSRISELIDAGANIIGGCCGTTPEHIRAIAEAVRKFK